MCIQVPLYKLKFEEPFKAFHMFCTGSFSNNIIPQQISFKPLVIISIIHITPLIALQKHTISAFTRNV